MAYLGGNLRPDHRTHHHQMMMMMMMTLRKLTTRFYAVFRTLKFNFGVNFYMGNGKARLVSRRGTHIQKCIKLIPRELVRRYDPSREVGGMEEVFARKWARTGYRTGQYEMKNLDLN